MASTSEPSLVTQISGNPALDRDLERLKHLCAGLEVLTEDSQIGVVVLDWDLPVERYSLARTPILLRTDVAYPMSAMDMFWVASELVLADGRIPAGAESLETHFGRSWRRYSWHRNAVWVPGRDDLVGHFEFCVARLQRAE